MIHQPKIILDNRITSSYLARQPGGGAMSAAHPDPRWYVLETNGGKADFAEANLKRAGYETFQPLVRVLKRDPILKTLTRKVDVPCFPGYLFVKFCALTDPWRWPVLKTQGVRRIFCTMTDRPIPVPRGEIERLIAEAEVRRVIDSELPPFAAGTELVVTAGPFADHAGVCQWSSETRTKLLLQMLGSEVVVEVARGAVRAK